MSIVDAILAAEFGGSSINQERFFTVDTTMPPVPNSLAAITNTGVVKKWTGNLVQGQIKQDFFNSPSYNTNDNLFIFIASKKITGTPNMLMVFFDKSVNNTVAVVVNTLTGQQGTRTVISGFASVNVSSLFGIYENRRLWDLGGGKFLVVGMNTAATNIQGAVISVSGMTVSVGTTTTIVTTTTSSGYLTTCELVAGSKYMVSYGSGATVLAKCTAFSISGTTITVGTELALNASATNVSTVMCESLGTDKAVVTYLEGAVINAVVVTASTLTLSKGTALNVSSTFSGGGINLMKVTTDRVIGLTSGGYIGYLTASGTTLTAVSTTASFPNVLGSGPPNLKLLGSNGTSQYYLAYYNTTSSILTGVSFTVDTVATTATIGTAVQMSNGSQGITAIDYNPVDGRIYTFMASGTPSNLAIFQWTTNTNTITVVRNYYTGATFLDRGMTYVLPQNPVGTQWYGAAAFNTLFVDVTNQTIYTTATSQGANYATMYGITDIAHINDYTSETLLGMYQKNGNVLFKGINDNCSGLSIGTMYYVNSGGSLTTTVGSNQKVGFAISATEILMKDYLF